MKSSEQSVKRLWAKGEEAGAICEEVVGSL